MKMKYLIGLLLIILSLNSYAQLETVGPFTNSGNNKLEWIGNGEKLCIEPFGRDVLRFRSSRSLRIVNQNWNLIKPTNNNICKISISDNKAVITNGYIKAEVNTWGEVKYSNGKGSDLFHIEVSFDTDKNEKLYGMGQYANGYLDLKGQLRGSGAPNEIWSFGDDTYKILAHYLKIREKLRPYIYEQMKQASKIGDPVMRPMFYDFPDDENTYKYDYQYMFGPDILVAPVTEAGITEKVVYLTKGAQWTDARNSKTYKGGKEITIKVDLNDIPVFCKDSFKLSIKD